jgi:signal transduction histidine kinase
LGLFVSRQIITGHGGTMTVTSTPGQGSTFLMRLPRRSPESLTRRD